MVISFSSWAQTCQEIPSWQQVELLDDDLLILRLKVNSRVVTEGLEAYSRDDKTFIPINALNDLLNTNWQVDVEQTHFHYDKSENTFSYEFPCEFSYTLNTSDDDRLNGMEWGVDGFDLYIEARGIALLLNGTQVLDFADLSFNLTTDIPLAGVTEAFDANIPRFIVPEVIMPDRIVDDRYSHFTHSNINYRATTNYDDENSRLTSQFQVNSFFDLLKHDVQFRLNQSQDSREQFIRFGRTVPIDPQQNLRYEFGDILLQRDELVVTSKQASGVQLFNTSATNRRNFSTITIEEITLPDWRAQLFRNGQFIDEVFTNEDNRVVFNDVETFYGLNQYEIKLYGPEGQQEVRTQSVNIGTNRPQGAVDYSLSYVDLSQNTIAPDDEEQLFNEQWVARLGYGLNQHYSVELAAYSLSGLGAEQTFLSSAIDTGFGKTTLRVQVAQDIDAGAAYFLGANADLGGVKLNFQGRVLDDFNSEVLPQNRNLKSDASLTLNGSSRFGGGFSWNSGLTYSNLKQRDARTQLDLRVNTRIWGGNFSTSLTLNNISDLDTTNQRINWSKSFNGWSVSNDLSWSPVNSQRINSYNATLRWPNRFDIFNETRVRFDNNANSPIRVEHLVNWRRKEFNLRFGAFVNDDGEWGINLGITGDIEYDPFNNDVNFYRPRGANVAAIHAFTFLDENRNAVFDATDMPLSDVQLLGDTAWEGRATNANGNVQLSTRRREQDISIDEASLPDIFMRPAEKLVAVRTHPGGVNKVALPVVTFNEVEGTVYVAKGNSSRGFGGLAVSLIDQQGEQVATTRTEVDGFFFFTGIDPGQYQLELDGDKLTQQNLTIANRPEVIDAPNAGDVIRINDLLLVDSDAAMLARQQAKPQTTSTPTPTPTPTPSESQQQEANKPLRPQVQGQYYVQLGVFKKASSMVEVVRHLPHENLNLKIYRHHEKALSYVVLGPYKTIDEASKAIDGIRTTQQFANVFVLPTGYFSKSQWSLEYDLKGIYDHLARSHQHLSDAAKGSYFCQLASYRSLTSVTPEHLNNLNSLWVAKRRSKQSRFYTFYSGPFSQAEDCKSKVDFTISQGKSFAIKIDTIKSTLLSLSE